MGNLSLRSYHRKIEGLIESGDIKPALFHCWHILKNYPKNYRTHQLLSRIFLDLQDLISAEKVFDIVLKINPDDFVAHIGKSMIAESSNNNEDAIKHMKQAFEIEPSNEGLQAEIKRLMGKNDSERPNKAILTRGALIKMYLRGELFEQAIAEIKIGINESPNRIDFKIALADCYYRLENTIQAVKTCIDILNQLPYCLKANEILHQIHNQNKDISDKDIYLSRLVDLDPYYAFVLPTTKSIYDVPDIAVLLEEWSDEDSSTPEINWIEFLEKNWKIQENPPDSQADFSSADWDSVIQRSIEPTNEDPFHDLNIGPEAEVVPNDRLDEGSEILDMGLSKKDVFINKLRRPLIETKNPDTEAEHHLHLNDEIIDEKIDYERSGFELPDEPIDEENLDTIHDVSPILPTESEWVSLNSEDDENHSEKENILNMREKQLDSSEKLNDTQPVNISDASPTEMIEKAIKALEGENYKYALDIYRALSKQESQLTNLSAHLVEITERYPDKIEYLLLLGEVFIRLDEKQKALEVFHKAQKLISF